MVVDRSVGSVAQLAQRRLLQKARSFTNPLWSAPQAHTLPIDEPTAAFKRTDVEGSILDGYQQPQWQPYPLSPQERIAMLDQAIMGLAARGGRLLQRHEWTAIVVMGKPVNHVLHLILTVLSLCCCGLWAPVWMMIAAFGGEHREILTVDQYGYVSQQRGPMETWRKVLIGVAVAFIVFWLIGTIMVAIERSHQSTPTGSTAPRQLIGPAVANVVQLP
jgi:hypothetical protein